MTGTAAVVAHFDPENRLDPTFRKVLECLKECCDRIVLVTTCSLPESEIPADPAIRTILRPNVGYDFYSYRVGIEEILRQEGVERLFVLNSSFLVIHQQRFRAALDKMLNLLREADIVGVTRSNQFQRHLQSYLLLIKKTVLGSEWFQEWLQGIEPRNSKLETILEGELGFSRTIAKNKVNSRVIFNPAFKEAFQAYLAWGKRLIELRGLGGIFRGSLFRHIREYNPMHFAAQAIGTQFGLIKAELLRTNPHRLNTGWIDAASDPSDRALVAQFIERSNRYYQSTTAGLTILNEKHSALPACNLVYSGPLARRGVRVAVVVHVFYPELIDEICECLRNIVEPFDLIATTPHEVAVPTIFNRCTNLAQSIAVAICENRGRDIGPFMAIHRRKLLDPYDAVLKLHTKRSTYSNQGDSWRLSLFRELCGNSLAVMQTLDLLRSGHIGVVGPHNYYLTHEHFWGANQKRVLVLLEKIGIHHTTERPHLGFFAGSMFWFKPAALSPIHSIPEEFLNFEPEAGQQDGTLAHAFERIICDVVRSGGYSTTSLRLAGKEIDNAAMQHNTVPVLSFSPAKSLECSEHR